MKPTLRTLALLLALAAPTWGQSTISNLPAASSATLTDVFPADQCVGPGCTKKITLEQLQTLIFGNLPGLDVNEVDGVNVLDVTVIEVSDPFLAVTETSAGVARIALGLHASRHERGGADELSNAGFRVDPRDHGAVCDGVTDDTAAFVAAIAAAEAARVPLYIPESVDDPPLGCKVVGSGSTIFTITRPIIVEGSGPQSLLLVGSAVPGTRDVFTYDPAGLPASYPLFRRFRMDGEAGAARGRYGINIKPGAAETVSRVGVEAVWFKNLGDFGVYIDGSASATSGATTTWVRDCNFNGPGVGGVNVRDSILIANSSIFSTGYAVDVTFATTGVGKFVLRDNNISASGGVRIGGGIYSMALLNNYFEPLTTFTGADNAFVNLDGATGNPIHGPVIAHNLFAIIPSVGDPDALRLNWVNDAVVTSNMFRIDPAAADAIAITANANRTILAPSNVTTNGNDLRVVDAGVGTIGGRYAASTLVFEGTPDANETTVTVVDPTADRTLTIPNASTATAQAVTCGGTDKVSSFNATTGAFTCTADSGGNSFETINAPAGTDPVAESATDTLNVTCAGGLTCTGTAATDTLDLTMGAAETGDTATAFFPAGQIEAARGGTGLDTSASTGVPRINAGTWTADAGLSHLAASTSADLAGVLSNETGSGLAVFGTAPEFLTSALFDAEAEVRFGEADVNGSHYVAFKAPASLAANRTCILQDAGPPIPDSCVGDGTDGGGGGTPGGSDTQVQFNDSGAFGGDAGLTYNKTTDALTVTTVNAPTTLGLTANGITALNLNTATSGVNFVEITPRATGGGSANGPIIKCTGSDTNVDCDFDTKGTGSRYQWKINGSTKMDFTDLGGGAFALRNSSGAMEVPAGKYVGSNSNNSVLFASGGNWTEIKGNGVVGLRVESTKSTMNFGMVLSPQTLTIADNGGGTKATATLTPTKSVVECTCNDADGCTVTMAETGMVSGWTLSIINVGTNACEFADTAGVSELAGAFVAGQYDVLNLIYSTSTWIEQSRSNN